jgi:hypothetical protein
MLEEYENFPHLVRPNASFEVTVKAIEWCVANIGFIKDVWWVRWGCGPVFLFKLEQDAGFFALRWI